MRKEESPLKGNPKKREIPTKGKEHKAEAEEEDNSFYAMVVIDAETRSIISKKGRLYDIRKGQFISNIQINIQTAINKLKAAEQEFINEVEIEFGENPYTAFLLDDTEHTSNEIQSILTKEVPESFGPSEESFSSLFKEIESLKTRQKKSRPTPLDLIPQNIKCTNLGSDRFTVSWDDSKCECIYEIEFKSSQTEALFHSTDPQYTFSNLDPSTKYTVRIRTIDYANSSYYIWSEPITVETERRFAECVWKECPDSVDPNKKYAVDRRNPRIMVKTGSYDDYCTAIGSVPLPLGKVTSWSVKILKSMGNDGACIILGVAPSDIDQNDSDNYKMRGWHFSCFSFSATANSHQCLRLKEREHDSGKGSGEQPQQKVNPAGNVFTNIGSYLGFRSRENEPKNQNVQKVSLFGGMKNHSESNLANYYKSNGNMDLAPSKDKWGQYVHTGDVVGVSVDTIKGDVSFALNGVDIGVMYEGIPLDKPLVPCVFLKYKLDSVELII